MDLPDLLFPTSKYSANKVLSLFCKDGKGGAQHSKVKAGVYCSLRGTLYLQFLLAQFKLTTTTIKKKLGGGWSGGMGKLHDGD